MRLKQATIAVNDFGSMHLFGSLKEAMAFLLTGGECDIVFISERFPSQEIKTFVLDNKGSDKGVPPAFVLVLGTSHPGTATR